MVDVTVRLGRVNVFIGANGSGKSNLLEAFGLGSAALSGQVDDESIRRRGVRLGVPSLYKTSLAGVKVPQHVSLEFEGDFGGPCQYSVSLNNPIASPDKQWRFKHERLEDEQGRIGMSSPGSEAYDDRRSLVALQLATTARQSPRSRIADALLGYAIFSANTPVLRGVEPDSLSREPVGLSGGGLPGAVQSVLRNGGRERLEGLLEQVDWCDSVDLGAASEVPISPGVPQQREVLRFVDRYMQRARNVLSGYDASEGVLYLLFAGVLALHANAPQVFAIDNFDQALSPRLARALSRWFGDVVRERAASQVLITTHNPLVLDGLPLLDDSVRLFAVDRDLAGRTVVNRVEVSPQMLERSRSGTPLSQQWVMGHLGGVPAGV